MRLIDIVSKRWQVLLIVLSMFLAVSTAFAQGEYTLPWWTMDGGGGASSGGDYTLSATIGQPDAGLLLSGGDYTLSGGFWEGTISGSPAGEPEIYLPIILRSSD